MGHFTTVTGSLTKSLITPIHFSGTSNKGHSEKGTTSLQGTLLVPFPITEYTLNLQEKNHLSIEDKVADPKVSFIRRFHCSRHAISAVLTIAVWINKSLLYMLRCTNEKGWSKSGGKKKRIPSSSH